MDIPWYGLAFGVVGSMLVTGSWRDIVCALNKHKERVVSRVDLPDGCNGMALSCLCGRTRASISRHCSDDHKEATCHDRLWAAAPARYR